MKRYLSPLFFLCFLVPSAKATASDLVAQIEKTYQRTRTFQAEFIQSTYESLLETTVTRPGRIFYERGGKLRIEYAGDKMTHYIGDGKHLWVKNSQTKSVQTYTFKNSGLPEEALRFLTELGNLRKYFKIRSEKQGFILTPKKDSTYRTLECTFNQDHYLETLIIHTKTGNTSKYRFFNLVSGKKLSPALFRP